MTNNYEQQLEAIKPLLDQIQALLAQGQHPDASARLEGEATAQQLHECVTAKAGKSLLHQAGEWHARRAGRLALLTNPPIAQVNEHLRYSVACMEADDN